MQNLSRRGRLAVALGLVVVVLVAAGAVTYWLAWPMASKYIWVVLLWSDVHDQLETGMTADQVSSVLGRTPCAVTLDFREGRVAYAEVYTFANPKLGVLAVIHLSFDERARLRLDHSRLEAFEYDPFAGLPQIQAHVPVAPRDGPPCVCIQKPANSV